MSFLIFAQKSIIKYLSINFLNGWHTKYTRQYGNGGPIIMVQVENEYGLYACDVKYKRWLRDEIYRHVGNNAVLFTTDPPGAVKCGQVENVLTAINFGVG